MVYLSDFIHIYENNLSNEICDFLISLFEANTSTNSFNLTDNREISPEVSSIHNQLVKLVINTRNEYYEYCYGKVFPEMNAFEKFILTKVNPDEECEEPYVDVKTYEDARRFLCFKWYLNDNKSGQTNFLDLTIQPEKGKLIVYPPFWIFPHKENNPIEIPKYTLTTYLHYK